MKHAELAVKIVLCVTLVGAASSKLASEHQETYILPVWAYYTAAVAELAIAALFVVRRPLIAAAATLAFAGTGIVIAAGSSPGLYCGCWGSLVELDRTHTYLVNATICALACLVMSAELSQQPSATANP